MLAWWCGSCKSKNRKPADDPKLKFPKSDNVKEEKKANSFDEETLVWNPTDPSPASGSSPAALGHPLPRPSSSVLPHDSGIPGAGSASGSGSASASSASSSGSENAQDLEKFRFSAEFIEMRRQALDKFINRVASHPELKQSEDLRIFLQGDEETMERARTQETGIFKKKPADFMQLFKDVQSKVTDVVLGKEKPIEESDPEYEKLKHYIFELEDHLAEAQKQPFCLVKRHKGR